MTTNQGLRQQSIRDATGTALTHDGDWLALFDQASIAAGDFNGRLKAWIDQQLGTTHANLPGAMAAFAANQGAGTWDQMGTFTIFEPSDLFTGSEAGGTWDIELDQKL